MVLSMRESGTGGVNTGMDTSDTVLKNLHMKDGFRPTIDMERGSVPSRVDPSIWEIGVTIK